MIETGFLVSTRHKERDILKAKASQELKLSLETAVRENASAATTNRNQRR